MPNEREIRPFHAEFPEAELTELRRRINATRWPGRETVTDDSQGVRLVMMQELARYWGTDYDWRKCEGNLNARPNFVTEIEQDAALTRQPRVARAARIREAPAGAPGRGIELQEGQRYDSVLAHARRAARGLGPAAR